MNAPDFSSGFASTAATNQTQAAAIGDGRVADYGGTNGHSEPQGEPLQHPGRSWVCSFEVSSSTVSMELHLASFNCSFGSPLTCAMRRNGSDHVLARPSDQ